MARTMAPPRRFSVDRNLRLPHVTIPLLGGCHQGLKVLVSHTRGRNGSHSLCIEGGGKFDLP